MRAVLQRVSSASVLVEGEIVGEIKQGILVLVGVEVGDTEKDLDYIVKKTAGIRIFEDEEGKMNQSLEEIEGELLVVSQFTLLGDARKGRRPSFIQAGSPEDAKTMFEKTVEAFRNTGIPVKTGVYQADMKVCLENDGPVTILLDSRKVF